MLLQCGTLISRKELCLEVSEFVFPKFWALAFCICPSTTSPSQGLSLQVGIRVWECVDMLPLSLSLEKQEDQEKRRKVNANLQVRKTSVLYTVHIFVSHGSHGQEHQSIV